MPKLPRIKPKKLISILKKNGFIIDRIHGSHYILYRDKDNLIVTVQFHNHDLKLKTLSTILKQTKLSVNELVDLL